MQIRQLVPLVPLKQGLSLQQLHRLLQAPLVRLVLQERLVLPQLVQLAGLVLRQAELLQGQLQGPQVRPVRQVRLEPR